MNMCVQIALCFLIYETIELEHDIEGLEEIPNLPCDTLEALNREGKRSKPNR